VEVHLPIVWWLLVQLLQVYNCFPLITNTWAEAKTKTSVTSKLYKMSGYGKDSRSSRGEAGWSSTEPFRLAWLHFTQLIPKLLLL